MEGKKKAIIVISAILVLLVICLGLCGLWLFNKSGDNPVDSGNEVVENTEPSDTTENTENPGNETIDSNTNSEDNSAEEIVEGTIGTNLAEDEVVLLETKYNGIFDVYKATRGHIEELNPVYLANAAEAAADMMNFAQGLRYSQTYLEYHNNLPENNIKPEKPDTLARVFYTQDGDMVQIGLKNANDIKVVTADGVYHTINKDGYNNNPVIDPLKLVEFMCTVTNESRMKTSYIHRDGFEVLSVYPTSSKQYQIMTDCIPGYSPLISNLDIDGGDGYQFSLATYTDRILIVETFYNKEVGSLYRIWNGVECKHDGEAWKLPDMFQDDLLTKSDTEINNIRVAAKKYIAENWTEVALDIIYNRYDY